MGRKKYDKIDLPSGSEWSSESTEFFSDEAEEDEEESFKSSLMSEEEGESNNYSDSQTEETQTPKSYENEPKVIITPFWISEDTKNHQDSSQSIENYYMLKKHMRLSMLERRINLGEDHIHLHPGMVPKLEIESDDLDFSEAEIQDSGDFTSHNEVNIVPIFWPRRSWDKSKDLLDAKELEDLLTKIQNSTKRRYGISYTRSHRVTDTDSETQARKFKRKLTLKYSLLYYETDVSDELTDWDDAVEMI